MIVREALKSILLVSTVSTVAATAGYLLDKSFWGVFLAITATQVILSFSINTFVAYDFKKTAYLAELEKLEQLSTILNCAYCNTPALVTFLPEVAPEIVCDKCKNTSNVKLHFTVARQTTPPPTVLSEPQKQHNIKL